MGRIGSGVRVNASFYIFNVRGMYQGGISQNASSFAFITTKIRTEVRLLKISLHRDDY